MSVTAGGSLSWTPSDADQGDHPVTARVSDGALADDESFTVHVSRPLSELFVEPNAPPVLQPIADQALTLGESLDLADPAVSATDPEGGPVTFELFGPTSMSIDPNTGRILWTPTGTQLGVHDVTVKVTDPAGLADAKPFVVTVRAVNRAPQAEPDSYTARLGETLTVAAPGVLDNDSDPDGDALTAIKVSDPTNGTLSFNADGSFDYTPRVPTYTGVYTVHEVTDTNLSLAYPMPKLMISTDVYANYPPVNAVDNRLDTSWRALYPSGEVSYEQGFVYDVTVAQVQIFSTRTVPNGNDFRSGTLYLYDANGNELFNTGVIDFPDVALPPDQRDVTLDIAALAGAPVPGVRRVRFASSDYEGNLPGLAEIHVIGDGRVHQSNLVTEQTFSGPEANRGPTSATFSAADLDGDGLPEVVAPTNTAGIGNTRWTAYKGSDGSALWQIPVFPFNTGLTDPAQLYISTQWSTLTDIDNDGRPEFLVAAASANQTLVELIAAFEDDGTLKWVSEPIDVAHSGGAGLRSVAPAVADLDGDGDMEIVVGYANDYITVYDHNGHVLTHSAGAGNTASYTNGPDQQPVIADIDLDGRPEILYGDDVYAYDGSLRWSADLSDLNTPVQETAANLDDDPQAEVVLAGRFGALAAVEHDGSFKWLVPGALSGGARFAIADIDGDGHPNIVTTGATDICSYDHNGAQLWCTPHQLSTAEDPFAGKTAPTAFDFDGDGVMEVVFRGKFDLMFYDGRDGTLLLALPMHTAFIDLGNETTPLVVDQDGDGQAEIVIPESEDFYARHVRVMGPASGSWPATRPIWNAPAYQITNVNPDGTVPSPEPINWLTPGLNNARVNVPLPEERASRKDSFTYQASDGALSSNEATVFLDVLPAGGPPAILSQAGTTATVGFRYEYRVLATDPDVGDVLGYALSSAPAGMGIDPVSGRITWTPGEGDAGDHPIGVTVTDTLGFSDFQAYTLTVGEAVVVPDLVGLMQADAETDIDAASLSLGQVTQLNDPVIEAGRLIAQSPPAGSVAEYGGLVDLTVSLGPGPGNTDGDSDGFTPNQGDCNDGDGSIHPGAADTQGDGIDQNCDGADGVLVLAGIVVGPAAQTLLTGRQQAYSATGILDDGTSINLAGLASWSSDSAAATVDAAGTATGQAAGSATIEAGYLGVTGEASLNVVARVGGDALAPIADIADPAANSTITAPTDITGSASDANFLKYELAIAPAGESDFTLIDSSTTPVTDGVLGQLDPTLLINDQYRLRLSVFDRNGNVTTDERIYQVDESMKVGNFTLTFTDLSIPLSGIPITITRTYDSRDKGMGDFGIGWRLGIQNLRLRTNRPLATRWQMYQSSFFHQLLPNDAHKVSITLPDGRVEEFDMVLSRTQAIGPGFDAFVSFQPRPGTLGTLALDEDNLVNVIGTGLSGEAIEILNYDLSAPFEPQRFRYTQLDGTKIVIVKGDGVESLKDTNGNALTFGPGGITHSSGKSVVFTRDIQGRITEITDPSGNTAHYDYDANGDLVGFTDPLDQTGRFTYGPDHYLLDLIDPEGHTITRSEYDADGRLVAVVDALGNHTEITHDLGNRQELTTDRRGFVTISEYDDHGNVVSVTDPLGHTTTATFDARNNKLSQTDPLGHTTSFTYNDDNLPLTETDPLGHPLSRTYDAFGRVLTITDRNGQTTTNTYDARGNLLSTTDPLGFLIQHTYDASGNRISTTNPLGGITGFAYDGFGNLSSMTDPLGRMTSYVYDTNGNLLSESKVRTTPAGPEIATTAYAYDQLNRRVATTDALGGVESSEYDAVGNQTALIDRNGNRTDFAFDGLRNLVSTTFADSTVETYTYDQERNRLTITDRGGRTTSFDRDALGRRIGVQFPDGAQETMAYDAAGRLISETNARGHTRTHTYDAADRRVDTTDPLGNKREFAHDNRGDLIGITDENDHTTNFEYDAVGRRVRTVFADGADALTTYDGLGRVLSRTDANGNTTAYAYDAVGNLLSLTDTLGQTTSYDYDEADNRITQTDAAGRLSRYEYDALDRLNRTILPLGMSESRSYDPKGSLLSVTDFNGNTLGYEYDQNDRPLRRNYPDSSAIVFAYTDTGRRESATDGRGETSYEYDLRDRLIQLTDPSGDTVEYQYDANGNRTAIETAAGVTTYTYDTLERIATATDPGGGVLTYAYDPTGNPTSLTYPNGTATNWDYDDLNRVTAIETRRADTNLVASYAYTPALSR